MNPEPARGGVIWRRVSRGLTLIGLGAFLLLNTSGLLPWSFWWALTDWWPILLIAIGVRLAFERSRTPWLVLLSPVLVLGTMGWVAVHGPLPPMEHGPARPLRIDRPAAAKSWTLDARLALGEMLVAGRALGPGLLVEGTTRSTKRGAASAGRGGTDERPLVWVRLSRIRRFWFPGRRPGALWELGVARDLPLSVDLDLAMTHSVLDLENVKVSGLTVDGAFNDIELRLGEPEREIRLDFDGAFSRYRITVPESVPVRVSRDGALNLVEGRAESPEGRPGYRVQIEGAFNHLEVVPK